MHTTAATTTRLTAPIQKAPGLGGTVRAAPAVGGPPRARVRDALRADGDGGRRADGALRRAAGTLPAGPQGPQVWCGAVWCGVVWCGVDVYVGD